MTCELCNGTGLYDEVVDHTHIKVRKVISVPCYCFISKVISNDKDYKLLQHMGEQYLHPDKLDPRLLINYQDLSANENFIIEGSYDTFLFMIKALIMKNRFDLNKPRILLSRSIDIVHDFHVPQGTEDARHLSAIAVFDLAVIVFGSMEVNKAIAPCMAELVSTRLQDKKPTWIYFQEVLTPKSQEYSEELLVLLEKFSKITIHSDQTIDKNTASNSKRLASKF